MAAPLLQAQIDIDAPVAKVWTLVSDLSRMPQWSPQCRMMKALGAGAPRHEDDQRQPAQSPVLADDMHGDRGHSGEEAGVQGRHQQNYLELLAGTERNRHPPSGNPPRRERRDGLLQHEHQRVDGRCAEFRTRTRRRHERDTVAHQGRCEELVSCARN